MGLLARSIPPGANTCLLSHQPKAQNRFPCPQLEAGRFWQSNSLVWRDCHAHASPRSRRGCSQPCSSQALLRQVSTGQVLVQGAVVLQDTLREEADLWALRECHTMRGYQMLPQAIAFILCAQEHLLFSPCKTKKTKEKYIECYFEMNQLNKSVFLSLGWSCRLAELFATGCSTAHSPSCPPHQQHHEGSQWVPDTCIRAQSRDPPAGRAAAGLCSQGRPQLLTCPPVRSQCDFVEEAEGLVQHSAEPRCASQWVLGFMSRGLAVQQH